MTQGGMSEAHREGAVHKAMVKVVRDQVIRRAAHEVEALLLHVLNLQDATLPG